MYLFDTLANFVSMLGTSKDKATAHRFAQTFYDQTQLEAAYSTDWVAQKVIDIPPWDMVREGRDWKASPDQIEKIEEEEARLGYWDKLMQALRKGRLYGGGAWVLGLRDMTPEKPLPEKITTGDLLYIHAVSRHEITAGRINRDLFSPMYGEPEEYTVSSGSSVSVRIHPSRVIRFVPNKPISDRMSINEAWGPSVLQPMMQALLDAAASSQIVASMMNEAKLDVIRIPNLMSNIGQADYRERLQTRFSFANVTKSSVNALILDKEEEYEQKQLEFDTLPEILDRFFQMVSGAADIPATRMLSQAPAGMNATGESDLRNYYDRISAEQKIMLTPALRRVDELLIMSALGSRPPEVWYEWRPLWQMSEKEKADVDKTKAETAQIDANTNLIPVDALAKGRVSQAIEDGVYPGLEQFIEESDQEVGEVEEVEEEGVEEEAVVAQNAMTIEDSQPRTLYVSRKLKNAGAFLAWAESQGFTDTLNGADLHVTIAFSRTAIDWMKVNTSDWQGAGLVIPEGGPRLVEPLGPNGAIVLLFNSSSLRWRHEEIKEAGASWDWDGYQPHVTITYNGTGVDLSKVEPYRGKLIFGPEIFEEIDDEWVRK